MAKIAVIGAGFSGLSAAAYVAAAGHEVHVFEKNSLPGGRARQMKTKEGYLFDMGPSWYWMPDIFENFFSDFGYSVRDFYKLSLLDPAFEIVFEHDQNILVPSSFEGLCALFESIEPGSASMLKKFMKEAENKYNIAMNKLVYRPGLSWTEYFNKDTIGIAMRSHIFQSFGTYVRKFFTDPRLIALMEFPVLFLGAMPDEIPALYSLMNYAGLKLGTWYPDGGFGKIIESIVKIASVNGTSFHYNAPVKKVLVKNQQVIGLVVKGEELFFDAVIATADYSFVEKELIPSQYSNYKEEYWEKKTFAPSCLIYFVGLSRKLESIQHHSLFFEDCSPAHALDIYKNKRWPAKPQFYVCCPSKTDRNVAPQGHENLFFLMPVAPGLEDPETVREKYFDIMIDRLEKHLGQEIRQYIDFKKSYCVSDFVEDYHAYKGNAYGLSNTLKQTAIFKPKVRNKKLSNLFYAGQLTVPGPGVPPSLISGKIAAGELLKMIKRKEYEAAI